MKYPIVLVEYLDHFWFRMDVENDWKKMAATPVTITTIGALVYEDEYQMALLCDYGSANNEIEGHVMVNVVIKSCIIRRKDFGKAEVNV